ncbi:hypothetical protein QAD02_019486 [Eretmocerus hayati]|uniref:Uncharacterized protein n=1 Tax=Eretmocerus hayati TaxID=131215 RepID=A0ACC2PJE5_9HYME|nr:hypothetical protein QAD02_019486 [Eretmocerus hayati]
MPIINEESSEYKDNSEPVIPKEVEPQPEEITEPESELLFETEPRENDTQDNDDPGGDEEIEVAENDMQHEPKINGAKSSESNVQNEDESPVHETETAENDTQHEDEPTVKLTNLPIARVRKIIKTDPEISLVNQEAVFLITKATELFINCMTKESYKYTYQSKKKTIQKHDVQSAIDNVDALIFLDGT